MSENSGQKDGDAESREKWGSWHIEDSFMGFRSKDSEGSKGSSEGSRDSASGSGGSGSTGSGKEREGSQGRDDDDDDSEDDKGSEEGSRDLRNIGDMFEYMDRLGLKHDMRSDEEGEEKDSMKRKNGGGKGRNNEMEMEKSDGLSEHLDEIQDRVRYLIYRLHQQKVGEERKEKAEGEEQLEGEGQVQEGQDLEGEGQKEGGEMSPELAEMLDEFEGEVERLRSEVMEALTGSDIQRNMKRLGYLRNRFEAFLEAHAEDLKDGLKEDVNRRIELAKFIMEAQVSSNKSL